MSENEELIEEFLTESQDLLSTLGDGLLDLEKVEGEDADPIINQCFRAIHTVKGAAGFLGFDRINDLAHAMENVLSQAREKQIVLTPDHVTVLLDGTKRLEDFLEMPQEESNGEDISDLVTKLEVLIGESDGSHAASEKSSESVASAKYQLPFDEVQINAPVKQVMQVIVTREGVTHEELEKEKENLSATGEVLHSVIAKDSRAYIIYDTVLEKNLLEHAVAEELKAEIFSMEEAKKWPTSDSVVKADEWAEESDESNWNAASNAAQESEVVGASQEKAKAEASEEKVATKPSQRVSRKDSKKTNGDSSIRVKVDLLQQLMDLTGELVLSRNQCKSKINTQAETNFDVMSQQITQLQESVMKLRLQPVNTLYAKIPRMVRELAQDLHKEVDVQLEGKEVEMDRKVIESLGDPMTHIIRNAMDHGLETPAEREKAGKVKKGTIILRAYNQGGNVIIDIIDDGRGIDPKKVGQSAIKKGLIDEASMESMSDQELKELLFEPGFSTAAQVTSVSGRGVGMDVVRSNVEVLNGRIELLGEVGKGTTVRLTLPLTLAVVPALMATAGDATVAIPRVNIAELVLIDGQEGSRIERIAGRAIYQLRDQLLPVVRMTQVLGIDHLYEEPGSGEQVTDRREPGDRRISDEDPEETSERLKNDRRTNMTIEHLCVINNGANQFGLLVDRIRSPEEIVVKPLPCYLGNVEHFAGASIMGNGLVVPIFNSQVLSKYETEGAVTKKRDRNADASADKSFLHHLVVVRIEQNYYSVPRELVKRIDEVLPEHYQWVDEELFSIDGNESIAIVLFQRLEGKRVDPSEFKRKGFLILPKFLRSEVGLFVDEVMEILVTDAEVDKGATDSQLFLGNVVIDQKMTRIIDIFGMLKQAFPGRELIQSSKVKIGQEKKLSILCAEDSPIFQRLILSALQEDGYSVELVENGRDALMELEHRQFDLVITDIDMPVMTGFELLAEVKKRWGLEKVPVMALTARNETEDIKRGKSAGFIDYLVKFDKEDLLNRLMKFFEERD